MLGRLAEATQQASQAHHALLRAIESLAASGVVGQIASTPASFAARVEETRALGASYETLARNTQALSSLHQSLQASTRAARRHAPPRDARRRPRLARVDRPDPRGVSVSVRAQGGPAPGRAA
jgi:hypothetical protein